MADAERITLGRNQFLLLTDAIEGLLALLVEDWMADAPVARNPWEGAGLACKASGTGEVWAAIHQGRAVLSASKKWEA